ncbi:hypothetical protein D3C85_1756190 [compost metagenome]
MRLKLFPSLIRGERERKSCLLSLDEAIFNVSFGFVGIFSRDKSPKSDSKTDS